MRVRRPMTTAAALAALLVLAGCADTGVPADEQAETAGGATTEPGAAAATEPGAAATTEPGTATTEPGTTPAPAATAAFLDPDGQEVGTVELTETGTGTQVHVMVSGMEPGFHGLHIHTVGLCEPDSANPDNPEETGDFLSAGPHLNPDDVDHPDHAGDLGVVLVTESGEGMVTMATDRFAVADLQDADGAAFMVHSERDNLAHIPDRYGEADQDTLSTGDAGDRVACAVVE